MKYFLRFAIVLLSLVSIANTLTAQNNECSTPTVLTVQTNNCSSTTSATTVGATQSSQTAFASGLADDDIWFKFTTPAGVTKVTLTISTVMFTPASNTAEYYLEARDNNSGICNNYYFNNTILPSTGGNWALTGLSASTDYSIRVYTGDNVTRVNFTICAFTPPVPTPPSNDECVTAATLTPVTGASCTGTTSYNTIGATASVQASGDGAGKDDDVWFTFTTGNAPQIYKFSMGNVTYETSGNSVIELFGSCSVTGNFINWWSYATSANFGVLQTNTTYKVRVYTSGTTSRISSFFPCISMQPVPVDDECSNAAVLPVNTDGTYNLAINATTVNASQSTNSMIPCTTTPDDDVWFKFTAPASGAVQMNISNSTESMFASMYSGNCSALTNLRCINNASDTIFGLTANAVYYLRIMTLNTGASSVFTVALRSLVAVGASNISCATAASLSTNYQQATTAGLATNSTIIACYGSAAPNKVLWYSFTATATDHFIDVADMVKLSANVNNLGYRVYSGTCASLTSIKCVDVVSTNNSTTTGLTIGNIYFVQVMENTFNGGAVQFKIKLSTGTAPANDEYNGSNVPTLVQAPTAAYTQGSVRFSTLSATPPTGTFSQDVWYKFYAATSVVTVNITDGFSVAPRVALYEANGTTLNNAGANSYSPAFSGLTEGNLYYLRILNASTTLQNTLADFKIAVYGTPSSVVADAAPVGNNCVTADGTVTSTNSGRWLHITHQGKMLASILDNAGNAMGVMTAKYFTNSAAVRSDASGVEYLDRNYEITPTVQPSNPVMVRLYFSKVEFDAMINANDGDGNDVLWLSDLKIAKFSSVVCASTLNLTGELLYNIRNWGALNTSNYFVDVQVPAFSSFFLKTVAGGLLPVTCSNFNYKLADGKVQLLWSTQTEINAEEFAIQRSNDGVNFTTIATITAAGNSNSLKNYQYTDALMNKEVVYYRLQQIDNDGKQQFICRTLKVSMFGKVQLFSNAYPNPVTNRLTIDMIKPITGNVNVQIVNALGQVLQQQSFNLVASDSQLQINTQYLKSGIYSVRIVTNEGVQVKQITKM